MYKPEKIRVTNNYIDFTETINFDEYIKRFSENYVFFKSADKIKIEPGDKLCLIPYGRVYNHVLEYEHETHHDYHHYLDCLLNHPDQKVFIDIDTDYNAYLDLIALFILNSKKIKYDDESVFDHFFGFGSNLIFNDDMVKYNNCWFLDFDS